MHYMQPWFGNSMHPGGTVFIPLIGLVILALWVWILVDCARRDFRNGVEKALWILALAVMPLAAAAVYIIVIKFINQNGLLNPDFRGPSPAPTPRPTLPPTEPATTSTAPEKQ